MSAPTLGVSAAYLASQALCRDRDARRYLTRRHGTPDAQGVWLLTIEQYGAAYDALRRRGAVYTGRAAYSAGVAQLARSDAATKSRREK